MLEHICASAPSIVSLVEILLPIRPGESLDVNEYAIRPNHLDSGSLISAAANESEQPPLSQGTCRELPLRDVSQQRIGIVEVAPRGCGIHIWLLPSRSRKTTRS